MWTRLVAGAVAHDVNNLAQGLFNLLALASAPGTSRETLEHYAALARDGLKDIRRLGTELRALAGTGLDATAERLDLAVTAAVTDLAPTRARTLALGPLDAGAYVAVTSPALRLAIQGVVRYALAASAPGGVVRVSVVIDAATAVVIVVAPTAPAPHAAVDASLGQMLSGDTREFGGDAGLVLAGAVADLGGGRIDAGPASTGGLRFKLSFPRVAPPPVEPPTSRPA